MKVTKLLTTFITLFALAIVSYVVFAAGGNPLPLFTANILATGTTLLSDEMEQQLLDRLNDADVSIDAALYTLNRVSVRDALIAAHSRGVAVRVVTDDDAYQEASYKSHFQALEAAGITLVKDNRSSLMHNKFFVIDGAIVWTGSTNMTDTGFSLNHNNSLVFTSTQVADIYTSEFVEMVGGLFGTAKTDNTTHTLTYAGLPLEIYFSPSDNAMSEVISEINAADESIYFSIFYLTSDDVRDALIAKIEAGVSVQGIFDLLGASNQYSDDEALCNAGAQVKIESFSGKMHNRFLIIDVGGSDPVVVTGSMNWSVAGGEANDENTVIVHDAEVAQAYLVAYQALYNALAVETLCEVQYQVYLPLILKLGLPPRN